MATTNYSWVLPSDGGSVGTWGAILNKIFGGTDPVNSIDVVMKAVSDVADAALPKAGGVVTGNLSLGTDGYLTEVGVVPAAYELDLNKGNFFYKTLAGTPTFTFVNPPSSGTVQFFTLQLKQAVAGGNTVTWPSTVKWQSGVTPTLASGGNDYDIFVFYTVDGGTSYYGAHAITDPS